MLSCLEVSASSGEDEDVVAVDELREDADGVLKPVMIMLMILVRFCCSIHRTIRLRKSSPTAQLNSLLPITIA